MRSKRTRRFREQLQSLPLHVQQQANGAYRRFKRDPYHPSLQFKRVAQAEPVYSVRVGLSYRALGLKEEDDLIIWFWIGTHAEYDKLIGQR